MKMGPKAVKKLDNKPAAPPPTQKGKVSEGQAISH